MSGSVAGDLDAAESCIDSTAGDALPGPGGGAGLELPDLLDGFPENMEDMVTVDVTSIYGEEDLDEVSSVVCVCVCVCVCVRVCVCV